MALLSHRTDTIAVGVGEARGWPPARTTKALVRGLLDRARPLRAVRVHGVVAHAGVGAVEVGKSVGVGGSARSADRFGAVRPAPGEWRPAADGPGRSRSGLRRGCGGARPGRPGPG